MHCERKRTASKELQDKRDIANSNVTGSCVITPIHIKTCLHCVMSIADFVGCKSILSQLHTTKTFLLQSVEVCGAHFILFSFS